LLSLYFYVLCIIFFFFFFFSSRRRHTRCLSDWSSDVCSSDLGLRESDLPAVMAFANQTAAAIETARLLQESREMEEAMVLTLAGAIELREALRSRAYEHATLAERLAEHLGFDAARRRRVRYAALLQD